MKNAIRALGASNHSLTERHKEDYYATDPKCAKDVLVYLDKNEIWECACGEGHLSNELKKANFNVRESDIVERKEGIEIIDFLSYDNKWYGNIVTNPPYKHALEFIKKSLDIIDTGKTVCMFLKLTFLEGQKRASFFKQSPPKFIAIYSKRQKCALNGEFNNIGSSTVCYAWFVWEKGFQGQPTLHWI